VNEEAEVIETIECPGNDVKSLGRGGVRARNVAGAGG